MDEWNVLRKYIVNVPVCTLCKLYISTQFAEFNTCQPYVEDDNSVSITADREVKDAAGRQQSVWKYNKLMKWRSVGLICLL